MPHVPLTADRVLAALERRNAINARMPFALRADPNNASTGSASFRACWLLGNRWGEVAVLAGGTDLLSLMKENISAPRRVVNVKNIKELGGIRKHGAEMHIGATVTFDELENHADVRRKLSGAGAGRARASPAPRFATWGPSAAISASGRAAGITAMASACSARIRTASR